MSIGAFESCTNLGVPVQTTDTQSASNHLVTLQLICDPSVTFI